MIFAARPASIPRIASVAASLALTLMAIVALTLSQQHRAGPLNDRSSLAPLPSLLIDLNSASAVDLELLPMIGPGRARAIIDDRLANGPFKSVDDVVRVHGIGPGILAQVRAFAEARPRTTARQEG